MEENMTITMKTIQDALAAGVKKAGDINSPSSIAIVDAGRNLLAFVRIEGALLASIEISQNKAYTSRSMNMNTGDIMELVQPGGPLYGMEHSHARPLITFAGGVPITKDGEVIGAVGVAGGMPPDDEAIAQAVADAIAG
jgi:uncharacterized protein GlcG (DUF336 family)